MRTALLLTCIAAPLALAAVGFSLGACDSGSGDDAGVDVAADTNVGPAAACVAPPTPAAFPSGACSAPKPAAPDAFDEALAKVGLDRCTVMQDPKNMPYSVMNIGDPRQLADFKPLLQYPLRLPDYGAETAKWLDDAMSGKTPVASAIAAAAVRIGQSPAACPDPAWFIVDGNDPAPLTTALGNLASTYGADFDADATTQALAGVPMDLQRALAPVVNALSASWQTIADARAPALPLLPRFGQAPDWVRGIIGYTWTTAQTQAFDSVDVGKMTQAALWIATTIESVQLTRFSGATFDPVTLDTAIGKFVLRGAGNDDYEPGNGLENAAFLLDTGGDDTYKIPVGATTTKQPLSIAIDLGGKDGYGYVPVPSPDDNIGHRLPSDAGGRAYGISRSQILREGAALLGVGMLFDYGQDGDTYRSLIASQGVGVFGVGVLYDEGGDDDYGAESLAQGAGAWGLGLLLDGGGNDKYLAYNSAQGFGFTKGMGALVDEAGDDTYFTDPGDPAVGGDPLYPNAQLPSTGNTSMSQGCGEGHRPDSPDPGYEFAGGIGLLRDAHGKDSYTTSVFGQACSFAMGIGMLLEGDGDDTYEGLWYVQGAAAHTGVAYFDDKAGNDQYDPTFPIRSTSIGVGHDYSSVLHYDEGGDDTYHGPNLALGSGFDNGVGLMLVSGGTDVFRADSQLSLGGAAAPDMVGAARAKIQTLGVFVKASGAGSYVIGGADAGSYQNGTWSYTPENDPDAGLTAEKSVGLDRPSASASWP